MNIFNRKSAVRFSAQSNSIMDGFRKALLQYEKVNNEINKAEEKAEAQRLKLELELSLLQETRNTNKKFMDKIENFLN